MQVLVMATPSASKAAIARRSRSSIAGVWPSRSALAKSVPRGSVMVEIRTRRCPAVVAARPSSQRTPASPRLSVSAIKWACVTGTRSSAPKNSPTLIWCCKACCGTGPAWPARISFSSSLSFIRSIDPDVSVAHRFTPFGQFALLKAREDRTSQGGGDHAQRLELVPERIALDDAFDFTGQGHGDGLGHSARPKHAPPRGGLESIVAGLG